MKKLTVDDGCHGNGNPTIRISAPKQRKQSHRPLTAGDGPEIRDAYEDHDRCDKQPIQRDRSTGTKIADGHGVGLGGRNWLNCKEAAAYLGTSEGSIRNMVYRNQLNPRKPFGRLLFSRAELDRTIECARTW
jgi:hypothetical protein